MGFITEWIKNGKINKFKKQLTRLKNTIEKQEGAIIGKEKELHSLYGSLEVKQGEAELIRKQLASLGYVIGEEVPAVKLTEDTIEEVASSTDISEDTTETETSAVVKKETAPVLANSSPRVRFRLGRNVLSLNELSREKFVELIDDKYNELVSAYDKVLKVLYPQMYMGEAELIQKQNYINQITEAYKSIGNIRIDKAIDFLNTTLEVGVGYELEMQKGANQEKRYSNMKYKSLSAFMKNPVQIPNNAMKINVSIRSDVQELNKMVKMANINIYLFESARYSRDDAKEVFYINNNSKTENVVMGYQDVIENDYFYYNQTQCEVISDKVMPKNSVAKAMYKNELKTGYFNFVEPELVK